MKCSKSILVLLAAMTLPVLSAVGAPARPNVILIMVDDMGFSDIGCYGGEIATPTIDALAKGGVRFSHFYNYARCCPTRASLMTGLAPHQAGIGYMTVEPGYKEVKNAPPAYQGNLNDRCVTLAQVARSAGYATFMTGKWHLSGPNQDDWPLQRGFDQYYGCISGAARYFHPTGERIMYSGNTPDRNPKSTTDQPFYTTDAFMDHGLNFIADNSAATNQRPFFWYLAFNAPHWPLQAPEVDIDKYRETYKIGWDQVRAQRYQRELALGLIDPKWQLSPRDAAVPAWDSLSPAQKEDLSLRMAIYAAMIDHVDQNLSKLVAYLKANNLFDNTLILFLSDNGACAEGGVFPRGNIADIAKRNESPDISVGQGWANVSDTPFRLYKHYAHEGGTSTPFFMHWPARIKPLAPWYDKPAQIIDIMPTLIEVVGGKYPKTFAGHDILPGAGVSLTPAFEAKGLKRKLPLFMEHEGNAFVHDGDWKLVGRGVTPDKGLQPQKWELYNLKDDRSELHDLASTLPKKVKTMSDQWAAWAKRANVYPKTLAPNPGGAIEE